jgi:putative SOS response-associated peptidase YedK
LIKIAATEKIPSKRMAWDPLHRPVTMPPKATIPIIRADNNNKLRSVRFSFLCFIIEPPYNHYTITVARTPK